MKNKYNQYHIFQLDSSNTIQKTSHGMIIVSLVNGCIQGDIGIK